MWVGSVSFDSRYRVLLSVSYFRDFEAATHTLVLDSLPFAYRLTLYACRHGYIQPNMLPVHKQARTISELNQYFLPTVAPNGPELLAPDHLANASVL